MPVLDLTYPLTPDMPVYPGSPAPDIRPIASYEPDGFREQQLTLCSHTGTHIDAPSHLLAEGRSLDRFPLDRFLGSGLCIDASKTPDGVISWSVLQPYEDKLAACDFVLLYTGWGRYWGSPRYFQNYPVISTGAAKRLADCHLKGLGVDALSVDPPDTSVFPVHRRLLQNDILIIENLARLDRLPRGLFGQLFCLPLHLENADGAPARVAARLSTNRKSV
jgi:kynurenine formamidase